jgi:transposase
MDKADFQAKHKIQWRKGHGGKTMFLGIDVSKNTLDAALIQSDEQSSKPNAKPRHKVFANTSQGHQQMQKWLEELRVKTAPVCLEATGTWTVAIALALHEAGHQVSLVNPALIRAFAQSKLLRTKTGAPFGSKTDAQLIARFCQMHRPALWTSPAPEIRTLQALVRRLETLIEMHTMGENRMGSGVTCPEV